MFTRGSSVVFKSTWTDAGGTADSQWTCRINWGDGTADTVLTVSTMACNTSHLYMTVASKITLTVTDKDGGSVTLTRAITIL
jgi:hypothetical protein